ncbi:alpha/beta fold hydrolase [Pseudactinotalea sp. Z1748]|uniref:alpha/beta fold hydrolase n=1 Tax=Pseudactinotalea sp. Z1748 TaxID=3413027 RepID=UPI003C7E1EDB
MSASKVVFLPGAVLPAALAYSELVDLLGDDVEAIVKDLEVYRGASPPADYSLDTEVAGVLRETGARGWTRFHLVGYSGGGAAALACAASEPSLLLTLSLLEPAWGGHWDWSPRHERLWSEYDALAQLSDEDFMAAFTRLQVRSEVRLPEPRSAPPPVWMSQRPAGIRALMRTFKTYDLDRNALRRFDRPVYFALGGLSNPDQYGEIAERLGGVFRDFTLEVFHQRHHFDPPHRQEPSRLAESLRSVWLRGDLLASAGAD